jgi:anti-sigma regulatory factor (Ser/Thr protein kinase)
MFDAFVEEQGLPERAAWPFKVALDEVLSNITKYGRAGAGPTPSVEVLLRLTADDLEVEVRDDTRPFNPLDVPAPDMTLPVEARPVGGLGIFLVRKLMDAVEYEWTGGRNRLRMRRRLSQA